jgi:hypothetical protein
MWQKKFPICFSPNFDNFIFKKPGILQQNLPLCLFAAIVKQFLECSKAPCFF